jgi:hypothetical protein
MFTFQNCELLAEGKVLQHQAAATAKSANDGSAAEPKRVKHGSQVIAEGILGYVPMLLNSKVDGIVTRDSFPRGEMCNSDSSLGSVSDFFFPHVGANSNNVWLSPDERYLFVANNTSFAVTTLNYTEDPPNLTFGWPL